MFRRRVAVWMLFAVAGAPGIAAQSATLTLDQRVANPGSLAFSADGRLLRILGEHGGERARDQNVHAVTLDARTGEVLHVFNLRPDTTILSTTFDGGEALVAYGASAAQTQLLLLDTATGKLEILPPDWYASSDEGLSATLSGDGTLISFYSETGSDEKPMVVSVYAWPRKTLVAKRTSAFTSAGGIFGGGVTPDGRAIEFDNNRSGSEVVDLKTGRVIASFGPGAVRSPDGKWVVELPNQSYADESVPAIVGIRNGADGKALGKIDVAVSEDEAYGQMSGTFCGNSGRFLLASEQTVAAYAIPSGKLIAKYPAETWRDAEAAGTAVVACSATGTRVAILSGTRLTLHDVK